MALDHPVDQTSTGGGEGENGAKSRSKARWKRGELRHRHHHQRSLFSQAQVAPRGLLTKERIMSETKYIARLDSKIVFGSSWQ